jgi:chromate reductase
MRVLGVSGSLRRDSHNSTLLRAAGELVEEHGAEFEVFDGLKAIPPYDEDDDVGDGPASVARFRAAIAGADALLFATPEYNGSVPGQLKNAVDWASRPLGRSALWGKPVGAIGASTGEYGALWSQADLRKALGIAGARVLDAELAVGKAADRFGADGELVDEETRERLGDILIELTEHHFRLALAAA